MKNATTLFAILLTLSTLTARASTDSLNAVYQQTAALNDTIQSMNDRIASLKNAAAVDTYYDSTALAKAIADPLGTIYKYEWKFKGRAWTVAPFWMSLLIVLIVLASFYAVLKTNLLRDSAHDADGKLLPISQRPFSYSRTQLFWWTMIVLACFVLFFIKALYLLPLNSSCIILLGMGALVHVGGRIIDQKDLDSTLVPMGTRKQDQKEVKGGFFKDLLTDGTGVSIHRFQALVFNIIFGLGFIIYFAIQTSIRQYPLLEFSEWQLALLGVSAASYLAVKTTENNNPPQLSARQDAPPAKPDANNSKNSDTNSPT